MCVTSPWRHHTLAARASACPCWAQAGARQSGRHGKLQEHNATSMTDLKRVMCCVRPAAATQDEMLGGEQSLVCSGGAGGDMAQRRGRRRAPCCDIVLIQRLLFRATVRAWPPTASTLGSRNPPTHTTPRTHAAHWPSARQLGVAPKQMMSPDCCVTAPKILHA